MPILQRKKLKHHSLRTLSTGGRPSVGSVEFQGPGRMHENLASLKWSGGRQAVEQTRVSDGMQSSPDAQ